MSNKDASKKRIMSFVGKLSFSSKDNDEAGLDANHKDKPAKSKQRPASIQLSSNSKTHEGLGSNSSEWVESMEHIKDNGNNIKKKKKKKKKGLKEDLMDLSPRKQPVKLKHAPSIADMLTPAITTIKEPESLEQELRYKLEIANQELATLRALIIEKDHLIALLTLGSKDNHFNNSYTSSDTDDCNQTNEVDESKSIERKHLANLPFSLSSPSLRTTLPPKTLPQSTSTPSLLSLSGEIKPPSLPVTPPLRLPSIPTAPDPPKRKFSLKLRKIPSLKRTISTFVSVQVPQTNSPLSVSAPASPVTPPSFFSFGHLLVPPSKRDNSSSHPSSPNLSTTPAPWSAAGPLFPGINSPPATPPTTPSNQMKTLNPPSSAPSTPPTSAVPPSSTTPPTSATRPSSATLPTSATPPTLATPPTSVILPSTSTPRTLFNSIGSATPPDAMTLLNQITTLRPPTLLLSDLLTSESPPTLPTTSIPLEPQSASGINPRETAQIPFDPAPLKPQSLPNSTPRETLQSSPSAVPAPVKSKSAIGSRKLTDRIGHLSINTSITATQPALNSPDSPRLRHSAPSGSFSFISAFPGIPSKRKVFSPPPSPSRISPSPPFASDIAVIQSPTSTEAKPARKTSAPPQLSDTRPLSSSSSYDIIPRSGTPTPSPTKNPRTLSLKITPPSPLLISSPSLTSAHAVLAVTPGSPHTSSPHTSSPRTRTSTAIAETMPLVSQLQEKKNVLLQIESCERAYLLQLSIIIEIFLKPLREQAQTPKPVITTIEIKSIFSDIEALWSASKYFLESLGSHIRRSDIDNIGAFFLRIVDTFRVYTGYVQNYYKAASTIALSKQSSPSFVAFLKKKELELKTCKDLVILLLSPINRIHQFTIQLKLLQEVTAPTDPSYHSLGIAHAKMSHFAANLRERAKVVEAKHKVQTIQDAMHGKFISFVQSHRLYVMEGQLDLLIPTPSAFSPRGRRSQTNTRTSPEIAYSLPLPASPNSFVTSKSFYCFLFNDLLVLTKQKKNHYDYKRMYEVKDLDVISVKSELGNLLQIIHGASATTEHVFIMDAKSSSRRDQWITNLEKYIKEAIEKDLLRRPAPKELSTAGGSIDFETAEIIMQGHIGSGGSGCRVAKCAVDGKVCAVKIMPLMEQSRNAQESFVNEIKIIEQLHHTNIIEYLGHCYKNDPVELWLFMDYYPVSLQDYLEKRGDKYLKFSEILNIALFVAKGMEFLHTQKPSIMHRDLKSANILLSVDESFEVTNAKITDFDTARVIYSDVLLHTSMGTPSYMAPEVMDISMMPCGASYSLKADIYSYGMILVELLTLKPPYHELKQPFQLTQKILCGEPPAIYHPNMERMGELLDLVRKCTAYHPDKRPDAGGVVKVLRKIRQDKGTE